MRVQTLFTLAVLIQCNTGNAQWSVFRSVREELLPDDQRDINSQTVEKGQVIPKEIRVDWYGFTLKDDSNEIEDVYQYPVADPTLAPGDKIIKVRTRDVRDAPGIMRELRASPERGTAAVTISRLVAGQSKQVKISLHRANSLVLKSMLSESIKVRPPLLNYEKSDSWGGVSEFDFRVVAVADSGELIASGSFAPAIGESVRVQNAVFRGWKLPELAVGDKLDLSRREIDDDEAFQAMQQRILLMSGSSGVPKQSSEGGTGFLYEPKGIFFRSMRHIVGIGKKEKIKVDGKDLEVHVVINMK